MAHIFERLCYIGVSYAGGQIGFYSGDVLKLTADMQILKPTIFASVPRLLNKVYDKIKNTLDSTKGVANFLVTQGLESKFKNLR